jgi:hypothetical protein
VTMGLLYQSALLHEVHDDTHRQTKRIAHRPHPFLQPLSKVLRGSADLVNNAVLQIRDGVNEEQKAEDGRLQERRQIVGLRLKNVRPRWTCGSPGRRTCIGDAVLTGIGYDARGVDQGRRGIGCAVSQ